MTPNFGETNMVTIKTFSAACLLLASGATIAGAQEPDGSWPSRNCDGVPLETPIPAAQCAAAVANYATRTIAPEGSQEKLSAIAMMLAMEASKTGDPAQTVQNVATVAEVMALIYRDRKVAE